MFRKSADYVHVEGSVVYTQGEVNHCATSLGIKPNAHNVPTLPTDHQRECNRQFSERMRRLRPKRQHVS